MPKIAKKGTAYSKGFYCSNCGEWYWKYFDFGVVAERGKCTNCGVSKEQLKRNKLTEYRI